MTARRGLLVAGLLIALLAGAGRASAAAGADGGASPPTDGRARPGRLVKRVSFSGSEGVTPLAPRADESLHPLGVLGADAPLTLRLEPQADVASQEITWRVYLDGNDDRAVTEQELVHDVTAVGSRVVTIRLPEEQRDVLHGDEPRTLKLRVTASRSRLGEPEQALDCSAIFDARPVAIRPIHLASGIVRGDELAERIRIERGRHHLIQFARLPTSNDRVRLAELGVDLLDYLPERSFWARIDAGIGELAGADIAGGVVLARPVSGTMKMHAELAPERLRSRSGQKTVQVVLHWFRDATSSEKETALAALAGLDPFESGDPGRLVLQAPWDRLATLADAEAVQWIEPYVADTDLHSFAGNTDHDVTPLFAAPYDLDGSRIPVAVFDGGWIDEGHPDLTGRVAHDGSLLDRDGAPIGRRVRTGAHATHMAGIIASSGAGNALAKGSAPGALLHSYAEAYSYRNTNAMVAKQSALHGWRVANHSYGSGWPCADPSTEPCKSSPLWTSYSQHARDADTWAYDNGVLSVYSAGNNGLIKNGLGDGWEDDNWSTNYSGAAGKNVIATCAASRSLRASYTYTVALASSKGPASDGRVKPELCAEGAGESVNGPAWTTEIKRGHVMTVSTSPAAAQVTGIVALLYDAYKDLEGPAAEMPPALARAVLLHTADDMTSRNSYRWWNGDVTSHAEVGPDYTTGYGWVNANAAVDTLRATARYRSGRVGQGQLREYDVTVPAGGTLEVTVAWDDPPAAVGAARALVNNLDLTVTSLAGGMTYYPWVLDKDAPTAPAKAGINTVDNVEQVVFINPRSAAQTYRIRVNGTSVPIGPQVFQVVSSHDLLVRPAIDRPVRNDEPVDRGDGRPVRR